MYSMAKEREREGVIERKSEENRSDHCGNKQETVPGNDVLTLHSMIIHAILKEKEAF
jgi:hypothetical protein